MSIPVVGMGGVQRASHARDLLDAGATLVAVGTETFRDPGGRAHRRRTARPGASGRRFPDRVICNARKIRNERAFAPRRKPV